MIRTLRISAQFRARQGKRRDVAVVAEPEGHAGARQSGRAQEVICGRLSAGKRHAKRSTPGSKVSGHPSGRSGIRLP